MKQYFLKVSLVIILGISLAFNSCSHDESSKEPSNKVTNTLMTARNASINLQENAKKFAESHVLISDKISYLIKSETNIHFASFPMKDLEATRNEDDLKKYFVDSGVINVDELMVLIKNQDANFNTFVQNNPEFSLLKTDEQNTLISDSILAIVGPENVIEGKSCGEQWNIKVNRCNRDYRWAASFAIAATAATGGWGLLAVGAAIVSYHDCLSDAQEDYEDCKS